MAKSTGFRGNIRRNLLTGLAGLLPLILTVFLLTLCVRFANERIARPVNSQVKSFLKNTPAGRTVLRHVFRWDSQLIADPEALSEELDAQFPTYFGLAVAFLLGLVFLYVFGFILHSLVGQRIYQKLEAGFVRLPVVRAIYPHMKRLTSFLFGNERPKFSSVVAIPYPQAGTYSVAFVTGHGVRQVSDSLKREMLTCFVPTSPTPLTGFVILVPREDAIQLDITIDEAFSYTISGGVLNPSRQRAEAAAQPEDAGEGLDTASDGRRARPENNT